MERLLAWLAISVKQVVLHLMRTAPNEQVLSLDWVEQQVLRLGGSVRQGVEQAWNARMMGLAKEVGLACPACGRDRKVRRRPPMELTVLGGHLKLDKIYLECGHCDGPGVSVTRLLTGLSSGEASGRVELHAARSSAQQSYAGASRDLQLNVGVEMERTKVRRQAMSVETEAMRFAEAERQEQLRRLEAEGRQVGVGWLMFQGDGGMLRTGVLKSCDAPDARHGQTTPKRGLPRRRRETQYRELITLDVRQPGAVEPQAFDVLVPATAPEGERARRILALSGRAGLGDNTVVRGLGDMGSGLADAFDEAFVEHDSKFSADWHHTTEYVRRAASVLVGLDAERWACAMRDALWQRNRRRFNALIRKAKAHRCETLPAGYDKCPVEALATYCRNNWERLLAAEYKEAGLDFVSARAEAQVRERTKSRFDIPGAWRTENLEPKATLRSILGDGRWKAFAVAYLRRRESLAIAERNARLQEAVARGQLSAARVEALIGINRGTRAARAAA